MNAKPENYLTVSTLKMPGASARTPEVSSGAPPLSAEYALSLLQGVAFVRTKCPIYIAGTRHRILPRGPFLPGVLDKSAME
jgi:hypothetical protein